MERIARGSGHHVPEVLALLEEHKRLAKMFQGENGTFFIQFSSFLNYVWKSKIGAGAASEGALTPGQDTSG